MLIKIAEISWDTYDESIGKGRSPKRLHLPDYIAVDPQEVSSYLESLCNEGETVETLLEKAFDGKNIEALQRVDEALSNWLSDTYGWCTNGFGLELKK